MNNYDPSVVLASLARFSRQPQPQLPRQKAIKGSPDLLLRFLPLVQGSHLVRKQQGCSDPSPMRGRGTAAPQVKGGGG